MRAFAGRLERTADRLKPVSQDGHRLKSVLRAGQFFDLRAVQPENRPFILRHSSQAAVEIDRRLVPVEHRPLHARALPIPGDLGQGLQAAPCRFPSPASRAARTGLPDTSRGVPTMSNSCGRKPRNPPVRHPDRPAGLPHPASRQTAIHAAALRHTPPRPARVRTPREPRINSRMTGTSRFHGRPDRKLRHPSLYSGRYL